VGAELFNIPKRSPASNDTGQPWLITTAVTLREHIPGKLNATVSYNHRKRTRHWPAPQHPDTIEAPPTNSHELGDGEEQAARD
jgi:hypothetical protein